MPDNKQVYCDCDLSYNEDILPSYPGAYDEIPGNIVGTWKFKRLSDDVELMCKLHHPFFQQLFSGYKDESNAASCIAHAWCHRPTLTLKWLWSESVEGNKELSRYYSDLVHNVEAERQRYSKTRKARGYGYYCYDNNTFSNEDLDTIERDYPRGESAHIRRAYQRGTSVYKALERWRKYSDSDSSSSSGESK